MPKYYAVFTMKICKLIVVPGIIVISFALTLSCHSASKQVYKSDHPELSRISTLPKQIRAVGRVRRLSPGYCGIICEGGYLKVELDTFIPNFNYKYVYLITACLASGTEPGVNVNVIATLHTGDEKQCYYQNFEKPKGLGNVVYYQLSESETAKVHY